MHLSRKLGMDLVFEGRSLRCDLPFRMQGVLVQPVAQRTSGVSHHTDERQFLAADHGIQLPTACPGADPEKGSSSSFSRQSYAKESIPFFYLPAQWPPA